jgi:hypothetical protein
MSAVTFRRPVSTFIRRWRPARRCPHLPHTEHYFPWSCHFQLASCIDRYLTYERTSPHLCRHQAIAWRVDSFSVEAVHRT